MCEARLNKNFPGIFWVMCEASLSGGPSRKAPQRLPDGVGPPGLKWGLNRGPPGDLSMGPVEGAPLTGPVSVEEVVESQ